MLGSAERRRSARYAIHLQVELGQQGATTRDISVSGVFLDTREPYVLGAPIRFALVLERAAATPLRLACDARVVRVEPRGDGFGVAAAITSYWVEPPPQ